MRRNYPNISLKKILVTGGFGTVGGYIKKVFKNSKVILTDKNTLDVRNPKDIKNCIEGVKPDIIIHLAALTNVDFCEKNEDLAMDVNFRGTQNISKACKKYNIALVYISTSAVFYGGNLDGYSEEDIPNPSNIYAKAKLMGENSIQKTLSKFLIIRAGWMIGGGKKEKKFISYIVDKIKNGNTVYAVDDKFGTITYARDLLRFVKERLKKSEFGLYHYGSKGICSRYDIACHIRDMLNKNANIIAVSSKKFEKVFSAPRPKYEVLRSIRMPFTATWKKVVKDYIIKEII